MSETLLYIKKEYANLVPDISPHEYESLKQSIKDNGYWKWSPITINTEGVILDGHHRFKICQELGIEPTTTIATFNDELEEKLFVIESNLKRRQLNDFQKAELGYRLETIESEKAEKRQKAGTLVPNDTKGRVIDTVADKIGLSPMTYYRAKKIIEEASDELKEQVRSRKISINYASKTITRAQDHKEPPKLPEGEFDIILADPPWSYDINTRGSPDEHYAVMTNEEIEDLKVPSAENAILFLWATAPKIKEALEVMKWWGFEYKTHMIWVKPHFGTGYYIRGKHELLLIGEKGDMPVPEEHNRPVSVFDALRREHSQKPDMVYSMIQQMYPNRQYLEMFARYRFNDEWTVWGKEEPVFDS